MFSDSDAEPSSDDQDVQPSPSARCNFGVIPQIPKDGVPEEFFCPPYTQPEPGLNASMLHPLVVMFQLLISRGVLPDDCFLMVYLTSLFTILHWSTSKKANGKKEPCPAWSEEVYDVTTSLVRIGGRSAYNFINGPGQLGMGKNSGFDMKNHLLPLPSWSRLQVRLPEWTLEPGVYVDLHRSNLDIASDLNRQIASWGDANLQVFFFSLGSDGMAIKPSVQYETHKTVLRWSRGWTQDSKRCA